MRIDKINNKKRKQNLKQKFHSNMRSAKNYAKKKIIKRIPIFDSIYHMTFVKLDRTGLN